MILAIDCGNTNITFALYNLSGEKQGNWRLETRSRRPADDYAVALSQLLESDGFALSGVSGCALASVVPEATPHLTDLCKRRMGIDPVIAEPSNGGLGMEIRIDQPAQLGADRLVNAYSVACSGDVPAIVLDFGTATTFDIVLPASDKKNLARYDGGV
ncbi:MAG: type III pantothenate kinase, partial [Candidatus Puniceispirillaceae bacterium]